MPTDLIRLTTALSGRYRAEREVGAGGMATVYLAYDARHDTGSTNFAPRRLAKHG